MYAALATEILTALVKQSNIDYVSPREQELLAVYVTYSDQAKTLPDNYKFEDSHGQGEVFDSGKSFAIWIGVGAVGFILLFLALSVVHILSPGLKPHDIADQDLLAPENAQVVDHKETARAVERAKQSIFPVFQVDKSRNVQSITAVDASLARIEKLQEAGVQKVAVQKSGSQKTGIKKIEVKKAEKAEKAVAPIADLKHANPLITDDEIALASNLAPQDYATYRTTMHNTAARLIEKFHRFPVMDRKMWEGIVVEFLPEAMDDHLRQLSAVVLAQDLEPNLVIDPDSTRTKANAVVKTVQPVMKSVTAGDVIVHRGSFITSDQIEVLQALGVTNIDRWPFILSMSVSMIAALTLVALFLYTYEPKHFFSANSLGLMFVVTVTTCALASMIGKSYPQFVPLPALALILTIFFGNRVALVVTLPVLMLIAVDRLLDMHHLVSYILASMVAIFAYSKGRKAVLTTALFIAIAQVAGDLAASALDQTIISWHMLAHQLSLDFLGGIASSILAVGSLPFLENIFGLITPFRIAELTDANQPLLKRLEENAPGTYQHSLAVANLAEAGAKAISADANLVRAGALYHDIGKMVRPKYFIENQLGATNPHDSMSPEDSRARVLAHVTDGIALAEKYALPRAIQDFIPMHQGTTLMAYFYHKACLRDGTDNVDPAFYRYPGPRPNSKETAIVMLADVSEAVTHSMHDPSQEEVEIALEKVFQNRWEDGQFLDSTLSYDELVKIKGGFARVWRTLHHERLKYPATTTGKMPVPPNPVAPSITDQTVSGLNNGNNNNNNNSNGAQTMQTSQSDKSGEPIENGLGI